MSVQWSRVVGWMLDTLPTLTGWDAVTVSDGELPVGDRTPFYATVGYVEGDTGGSWTTVRSPDGYQWQEAGQVRVQLIGGTDQRAQTDRTTLRLQVTALYDALENEVRVDRTLGGVLSQDSDVILSVDALAVQNQIGTAQAFVLTLQYTTVT